MNLENYKWQKRPLLLFAPASDNPHLVNQKESIDSHLDALQERDIVVLEIIGPDNGLYLNGKLQPDKQGNALRERFDAPADAFTVILVGKDGNDKLRKQAPVEVTQLFELIDSMPMRQQEMRDDQ